MQDNAGLILGICGLALVCVGLPLIGAFLALRLSGSGVLELFALMGQEAREGTAEIERSVPPPPRTDLRSVAANNDFDTALARQQIRRNPGSAVTGRAADDDLSFDAALRRQQNDSSPTGRGDRARNDGPPRDHGDLRGNRRYRDYSDDEVFGGLLDDDGDGRPDY
ncbi:MAG: hypothetical protein GYB67_11710 [Chloroflexi bacterium]|nr:hypothetical protein [Chloroflexota bacterium]